MTEKAKVKISYFLGKKLGEELEFILKSDANVQWCNRGDPELSQLILVDIEAMTTDELEDILTKHGPHVLLVSGHDDEYNFLNYISRYDINHLIGATLTTVENEIKTNIDLISRNKGCTIDSIVNPSGKFYKAIINDSSKVNDSLDELINSIDIGSFFNSPSEYLKILGNELVMNALYGAACDGNGNPLYNELDRKVQIKLDRNIDVCIGIDEHVLALSVKDAFGTLTREVLTKSLARSFREKTFEEKPGGAGLGFFLIFSHANQLIVNIDSNRSTEVICIIVRNKRFKSYKKRITSFHFFAR